jgi:hypothetical protein
MPFRSRNQNPGEARHGEISLGLELSDSSSAAQTQPLVPVRNALLRVVLKALVPGPHFRLNPIGFGGYHKVSTLRRNRQLGVDG